MQPLAHGADLSGMTFTRLERCPVNTPVAQEVANCIPVPAELGLGELILAQGHIERKTSEALGQFVGDMPRGATIILQSLGATSWEVFAWGNLFALEASILTYQRA